MAASLPLSVLLLLVVTTGASSQISSVRDVVRDLTDACFDGAGRSVAYQEINTGQQEIVQEITVGRNQTVQEIKTGQQETVQEITDGRNQIIQEIRSDRKRTDQKLTRSQQSIQKQLTALQQQLTALQPAPEDCPVGWSRHGDNCYLIPSLDANWVQAHHACAVIDRRARLASVHPWSSQFIRTLLAARRVNGVWIGLARLAGNSWGWSDGTPLDYTKWDQGEPTNHFGIENCVWLRTAGYAWHDYTCSTASNSADKFLCQISLG